MRSGVGLSTYSQIDVTRPPAKPRTAIVAAVARRAVRGTSTAESSAMNDAPSSTSIVEIENQSTWGVLIT